MTYSHLEHIGNEGDLIKHFALTLAVQKLAKDKSSFSYLDALAGRAEYELQEKVEGKNRDPEWKKGIGEFFNRCESNGNIDESFKIYRDLQLAELSCPPRKYWGSSKIVLNVLGNMGIQDISMRLYDIDCRVLRDLEETYRCQENITPVCGSGYEAIEQGKSFDLIFIDPPNVSKNGHLKPYLKAIQHCIDKKKPFISWNSLHGKGPKKEMSSGCCEILKKTTQNNIETISIRWNGWSGQMCGCQMLFRIKAGKEVVKACEGLKEFMGWDKFR